MLWGFPINYRDKEVGLWKLYEHEQILNKNAYVFYFQKFSKTVILSCVGLYYSLFLSTYK